MSLLVGVVVLVLAIVIAASVSSFQRTCLIDPIPIDLGPLPPARGFWSSEFNLRGPQKIVVGDSPEDVAFDSHGRVYAGVADGWIKRIGLDGMVENYTNVGDQILGLAVGLGDELYAAVPSRGLLKVSKDREVSVLSSAVDGTEIGFADGVVVAKDGTVYFSDASTKFRFEDTMLDLVQGRPNGRVLKYDPTTTSTSVLVEGLSFANGVALSENEEFLLIAETGRARVLRYWLTGEKKATLETFIDGLPAYPDNVRLSPSDGNFFIGLVGKRTVASDALYRASARLLKCLLVHPRLGKLVNDPRGALVIVVSPDGKLLQKYQDPTGKILNAVTGGNKLGNKVYISGLGQNFLVRLES